MSASRELCVEDFMTYKKMPAFTQPEPRGGLSEQTRVRFVRPELPPFENVTGVYEEAYENGSLTNGSLARRFEDAVAERLGVKHCIAVSSGTSALMLIYRALDLRGEIVLPSFTFFATGHAALWNHLRPVFADCLPDTWNLDPADVARKITPRTAAVVGVHIGGNPCNVAELTDVCANAGAKLVFDAAHAFGSNYCGQPIGGGGDAEAFSLTPTKTLVCGEGGLVTTNDAVLARRVRAGRNYGDTGSYDPELLGLNARFPEFNAAMGLAGLALVDDKIRRHNEIAALYRQRLEAIPGIRLQKITEHCTSTFKDFSIVVDPGECGASRDDLAQALASEGVETRKYYSPAMHQQKLYQDYAGPDASALPVSTRIADRVLSLPIYPSLEPEAIERIIDLVERVVAKSLGE